MSRQPGNSQDPATRDTIKVIRIMESNKKRKRIFASVNGHKPKEFSIQNTSGNLWKDQWSHLYEIDPAVLA